MELSFQEILGILKRLFSNLGSRTEKRDQREIALKLPPFRAFQAPLKGTLYNSGGFDPTGKGSVGRPHDGVDLRQSGGSSIYPIAPGKVKEVYEDPKGGHAVVLEHANGYTSYYAHCGSIKVHPGEIVDYSDVIATVGASGNANGFPHLHFQVWHNGTLIDPASLISIPPYTAFDQSKEKLWLPGAKTTADNWSMQQHLGKNEV